MKKLMTVAAAALCAAVAFGADAIESANAAGFAECPIDEAGMCSIGIAFKNSTGGDFVVENDLFGQVLQPDDQIYVFNFDNSDWDMYIYGGEGNGWTALLSDGSMLEGLKSIPALKKGEGCYYLPADWETPAIPAGLVEQSGEKQLVMGTEDGNDFAYQFVNPFPVDTKFSDFEGFAAPDDQVYIFNTLNADWDMYIYGGEGIGWTTLLSDGSLGEISEDSTPGYQNTVLLPANRAAWYLPAWNWDSEFPQSRVFKSVVNY